MDTLNRSLLGGNNQVILDREDLGSGPCRNDIKDITTLLDIRSVVKSKGIFLVGEPADLWRDTPLEGYYTMNVVVGMKACGVEASRKEEDPQQKEHIRS